MMRKLKTNILHLPILIEQDEDNIYIVSCPVFKGCHSYGKTVDEAIKNIKEVIGMCLDEEKEKACIITFVLMNHGFVVKFNF